MKITAILLALAGASCTSTGESAARPYPLDTCLVSDNELGSMGDPITIVYEGRELSFCCSPCVKEFETNPAEFLQKLER